MPAGRKTKLTPEVHAAIVKDLELGMYVEVACKRAGISKVIYYDWLKRAKAGKPADQAYIDFAKAVEVGSSQAEAHALAQVRKGVSNWQANAWFLERRFKDRWARTVDNSGIAETPVQPMQFVVKFVDPPKYDEAGPAE